jgi:site-specific DNA-methyltransferase (adenine-specific)
MDLYNLDCFEFFENYDGKKIDLVVVDLPYGQTSNKWDEKINLEKMWENLLKICRRNTIFCFFTTTRYGIDLINSKHDYFRYDLVWEKKNSVGHLSANKMPLRRHEMIYIFSNVRSNDTKKEHNKELREYSKKLFQWINKPRKEIFKKCGNTGLSCFYTWKGQQFSIPIKKNYQFLIDEYKINEMKDFMEYEEIKRIWDLDNKLIYNVQKTKGKPYKKKKSAGSCISYGFGDGEYIRREINNKGDRYPLSVLKYGYDKEKLHATQKPVGLCEWLIKTYSNQGGLVLDFCMGSGSTGVACIQTGRNFIGVEKDKKIFEIAKKRLENFKEKLSHNPSQHTQV